MTKMRFNNTVRGLLSGALVLASGPVFAISLETCIPSVGRISNPGVSGCGTAGLPAGHSTLFGASSGTRDPIRGAALGAATVKVP